MNRCYVAFLSLVTLSSFAGLNARLFTDIDAEVEDMRQQVEKMVASVQKKCAEAEKSLASAMAEGSCPMIRSSYDRVSCKAELVSSRGEKQKYRVTLDMPGFSKDDMHVTLEKKDRKKNVLLVKATQDFQVEEKMKNGGSMRRAESYSSMSSVDGMSQTIKYENGVLTVHVDLPVTIDIEGTYEMTFEDGRLTLTFPQSDKKDMSKKRKLAVTKKN